MATRLYLRDFPSSLAPPPGKRSTALPNAALWDSPLHPTLLENRSLLLEKGRTIPDSTIRRASIANTAHQDQYLARFTSRRLAAQTISANTWTFAAIFSEANASANSQLCLSIYVYRPLTDTVVGYIYDSHTALGVEWAVGAVGPPATGDGIVVSPVGSAVTAQAGDVICCEVWRHAATQGAATSYIQTLFYNSHVDVVDATTQDGAAYLETPQNLTWEDPVLPAPIPGVFVETPGWTGPVMLSNGDMYVFQELQEVPPSITCWKSSDGGKTWAEQDSANRPGATYEDLETFDILVRGTPTGASLFTVRQRSYSTSTPNLTRMEFRTSLHPTNPDTWGALGTVVNTMAGNSPTEHLSLVERSGNIYLFYIDFTSATATPAVYRKSTDGGVNWGAAVTVRAGCGGITARLGPSGKIHIAVKEDTSSAIGGATNQVAHISLDASDVLSSVEACNDTGVTTLDAGVGVPIVTWDDAGTEKAYVHWMDETGYLRGSLITNDGTPAAEEKITQWPCAADPFDTRQFAQVAYACADDDTGIVHLLYSRSPNWAQTPTAVTNPAQEYGEGGIPFVGDYHLWYTWRATNGTWSDDVEVLADTRVQIISASIFTHSTANGGRKVLGIHFDSANGVYYHEIILETPQIARPDSDVSAGTWAAV